jgi:glutamate synthase (NADPH/NADH) small chain
MGKPTGFLEIPRQDRPYQKVAERVQSWREFVKPLPEPALREQGARCMDCGVPFCHGGDTPGGGNAQGCPVNNLIPDWNNMVYRGRWREALDLLHSTNNFPEFTGRICPAPCEEACVLNINSQPVTIKTIECAIIDRGFAEGWVEPWMPTRKTGKRVAVVGSGPAGMAAAQQLARAGHKVTLFEKADRIGGLLRYGIPDFKMEKHLIDRRVGQMAAEGVEFRTNTNVGVDVKADELLSRYDAVVLSGGAEKPRDLTVPGREATGIYYAMDFLTQNNKRVAGDGVPSRESEGAILATGKHVVVIGGGDTGSDCIGTSTRQKAAAIVQLEILPRPPNEENKPLVWPDWPLKYRTSSSQEEGVERDFAVNTRRVMQDGKGRVRALECVRLDWQNGKMVEVPNSAFEIKADLVLLAMGFVSPVHEGMIGQLGLALDPRGNVKADTIRYQTSIPKVFAAGDMRRGQSLVVWAIREGRQCARAVDDFLMGSSDLPR